VFEEGVVGVAEVMLDELEKVIDDCAGSDGSFVVSIVIEKAIEEDMFERLSFHPQVTTQGDGLSGEVSTISGQER